MYVFVDNLNLQLLLTAEGGNLLMSFILKAQVCCYGQVNYFSNQHLSQNPATQFFFCYTCTNCIFASVNHYTYKVFSFWDIVFSMSHSHHACWHSNLLWQSVTFICYNLDESSCYLLKRWEIVYVEKCCRCGKIIS